VSEAILEEPEFLKELHKIREELARETREKAFKELSEVREKYRKRLGHLYIENREG